MNHPPDREETIFEAALQLPPAQRTAHLQQACGADAPLRQRIELLLKSHEQASGDFLEQPPALGPKKTIVVSLPPLAEELLGTLIGRYKLLEKIGEGGFGVVYVAEQREPVKRRVALKIIKLGMDTKQVVARFEVERQALALMDHPNIAKVFDAGATEKGRPYFVMELVRGIRITDYCNQNHLATRERLELFAKVCQAIQHAHQKGLIHRDIKPSNLLVTLHDGVPVPKVIDFGITKATQGELSEHTVYTQLQQFIGTPAYMSPEQAEMSGLDIDTRSDIYALGVLLYELLTGSTPLDQKDLLSAGLDGMRRMIREQEPQRPSTRVSSLQGEDRTTTATRHSLAAPKLAHLLQGDLDWIVMKCLEKDRTRRYDTANGVAADIQRHLSNEPVVARPPSTAYRFRKLVRRNQLAFSAAAAVCVALVAGLAVSLWLFYRETQAHDVAMAEARKARVASAKNEESARFLKGILESVGPSVALGRDTALLREVLDKAAQRVSTELRAQPEAEAETRATLGNVYLQVAEYDKAEFMIREALAIKRRVFGAEHIEVAVTLRDLGRALSAVGKRETAEIQFREALAMQQRLIGAEDATIAATLFELATAVGDQFQWAEAERLHREALALRQKLLGRESREAAESMLELAEILRVQKKLGDAEQTAREAARMLAKTPYVNSPAAAKAQQTLAAVLWNQGRLDEAESLYRAALARQQKLNGQDHPDIASAMQDLGVLLVTQGKSAEAEAILTSALAMERKFRDSAHGHVIVTAGNLAWALQRQGKTAEVDRLFRDFIPPGAENQLEYFGTFSFRAQLYTHHSRFADAAADMARAVRLKPDDGLARLRFAVLLLRSGDAAGYAQARAAMLARFQETRDARLAQQISKTSLLTATETGQLERAAGLADTAISLDPDDHWTRFTKSLAEFRRGRFSEARLWAHQALDGSTNRSAFEASVTALRAMAEFRGGATNEASLSLNAAQAIAHEGMTKLNPLRIFDTDWHNTLVADLLLREAETLIVNPPASPSP